MKKLFLASLIALTFSHPAIAYSNYDVCVLEALDGVVVDSNNIMLSENERNEIIKIKNDCKLLNK